MPHTTEIVEYKKISNGQVAALIRCCGNSSTDHWHTMAVSVASDPAKRKASIDEQRAFVSQQHAHANLAEAGLIEDVHAEPVEHPSSDSSGYEHVLERALQNQQSK